VLRWIDTATHGIQQWNGRQVGWRECAPNRGQGWHAGLELLSFGVSQIASKDLLVFLNPFVVVSWAWRRAAAIAQQSGKKRVEIDSLRDFVDRIDVIYVWSQLIANPNADLLSYLGSQGLLQCILTKCHNA
jgi:hypothetical protein